jgi:UDP-glucose 4-epimerase
MLVERGDDVVILDDLSTGRPDRVPDEARLEVGDVRDAEALRRALAGASVVFHLAARVSIRGSVDRFRDDHDVNLGGTLALLDALRGSEVTRLIFASSMAVYADAEIGTRLTEDHPTRPLSPYGASKLASEHYLRVLAPAVGIEHVSLRYFNTWGPGQALTPYVGAATIFTNALLDGRRPIVFGDGTQTRDFIHVDDVARATIAASEVPLIEDVLNVGTGRATSIEELLGVIAGEIGVAATADYAPRRGEELTCSVADPTRAESVLGVRAGIPLDVSPLVTYWRSQRDRVR